MELVTQNGDMRGKTPPPSYPHLSNKKKERRPKYKRVMAGAVEGNIFVGNKAREYRGLLKVTYPINHGIIQNWNDMENIWIHVYNSLKINSDEHPILLTEAPLNPQKNKEKIAEVFFETFNVPALFISMQAIYLIILWKDQRNCFRLWRWCMSLVYRYMRLNHQHVIIISIYAKKNLG
ncbi:hypothetical protein PFDG_00925 [Plasmodium falciparum Dd2]|uniref:Actin n=1 Tax=Plasmodium falciparum (isolate Dd2) TaxID=57267 RepID=A0A0L7LYF0_PLAF4|nr:hypothetical protein PFDG_00925 [Plasmodium falciparum Dd2]